jgi:eukaryotic-like serine/threonine-protein kinase
MRVGPYEVSALIGEGGMGQVYRATDTNLKRIVAIKVLPEAVASDAERLARFQREAELLASLNHPNIAAIYGLERTDSATALVLELVDGMTLEERIAKGPLPLAEALSIARHIAAALDAAHELGIIHRDLKPANIKVRLLPRQPVSGRSTFGHISNLEGLVRSRRVAASSRSGPPMAICSIAA